MSFIFVTVVLDTLAGSIIGPVLPELLKRGVTAAWTLNQQRVIRLEPPLIVDAAQIATALQAFDEAVAVALERLGVIDSIDALPASTGAVFTPRPQYQDTYHDLLAQQHKLYERLFG